MLTFVLEITEMIDKLDSEWAIFPFYGEEFDQRDVEQSLLEAIFPENPRDGEYYNFVHSFVEKEDEYWGIDDKVGKILSKKWELFSKEIKEGNRFFHKKTLNLTEIKELLGYLENILPEGKILYRARISHDGKK